MKTKIPWHQCPIDISDDDVLEAMKTISGFLDITPGDFREIYIFAYQQAVERLNRSVKAKHIMTPTVVSVPEEASLMEAAELMAAHNISGLPVVDMKQNVVGVISEKDFLYEMGEMKKQSFMGVIVQCLKNKGCTAISLRNQKVRDIMASPPITVQDQTSVFEIANLFEEKKINRVPVISEDSKLTGIVTRSDIVQSYCVRSS